MDGFASTDQVVVMAASNLLEKLDPALLRPGRFDRHVLVDRPDKVGREAILRVHLKKIKAVADLDVQKLAAMTPGMVGADLANIVNEAALLAVRRGKQEVAMPEFEEAVERIIAGLEKKNRLINVQEREIVAYHEMGHALVALSLPGTDPVQKISIIPRGIAALGYTMQVPTEDRFLMKKTELLNKVATLLGGRAAEELAFGDVSSGAANDLERASEIARGMVTQLGMSETLGPLTWGRHQQLQYLGQSVEERNYSEETSRLIDSEVRALVESGHQRAREILEGHRALLEKLAGILERQEVLAGAELSSILSELRVSSAQSGHQSSPDAA